LQLWADLDLGLSDSDVAAWQAHLNSDGSGTVTWAEFAAVGAEMLQDALHKGAESGNDPWVSLVDEAGNPYRVGSKFLVRKP
jgi:hypothetical protein